MGPRARKAALAIHVTSSVGWLGAVAGFLALAVAGLVSDEPQTVRSVYVAMEVLGWWVLVPLSLAAFLTGLVEALGTRWGLFRHYWVIVKLLITVVATGVLLAYTQTLGTFGKLARAPGDDLPGLPSASPALHAGAALVGLLGAVALAVFKPRGTTRRGRRPIPPRTPIGGLGWDRRPRARD